MSFNFDFIIVAFDICFWWVWFMRFFVKTGVSFLNQVVIQQFGNYTSVQDFQYYNHRKRKAKRNVYSTDSCTSVTDTPRQEGPMSIESESEQDSDIMHFTT